MQIAKSFGCLKSGKKSMCWFVYVMVPQTLHGGLFAPYSHPTPGKYSILWANFESPNSNSEVAVGKSISTSSSEISFSLPTVISDQLNPQGLNYFSNFSWVVIQ